MTKECGKKGLLALLKVLFGYVVGKKLKKSNKILKSDIGQIFKPRSLLPRYNCKSLLTLFDIHSYCHGMFVHLNVILYSPLNFLYYTVKRCNSLLCTHT